MTEVELVRHELESRIREHVDAIAKLSSEREQYKKLYMDLLERCKLLEKGIVVGKKAERFTAGEDPQLALQILETLLAGHDVVVEEVEEEVEIDDDDDDGADDAEKGRREPTRRRSRGRRPLPENLPRVEIEVLPPEVVREGLDAFERIGQVVSEVVERRPASLVVTRIVRPKFVRKGEASRSGPAAAATGKWSPRLRPPAAAVLYQEATLQQERSLGNKVVDEFMQAPIGFVTDMAVSTLGVVCGCN